MTYDLERWGHQATSAADHARAIASTTVCPEWLRNKPGETIAIILTGAELGLAPMQSLRAFVNIQGTVALTAIGMRAIVQRQGHEINVESSTDKRAVVRGRRKGEESWQESVWTIERAKQLGLTGKKNWQSQPAAMLVARATSEVCRWIGSDAILGVPYSSEELADGSTVVEPARRVQRSHATPALTIVARGEDAAAIGAAPTLDEPPLDGPALDAPPLDGPTQPSTSSDHADGLDRAAEVVLDNPDAVTPAQLKKMAAQMRDAAITSRDHALAYVSDAVGRDVASRNDLTKREASTVIEALAHDLGEIVEGEVIE